MSRSYKCDKCGQFKVGSPPKGFTFGAFQTLVYPFAAKDYCVVCLLKVMIDAATAELKKIKEAKGGNTRTDQ
jgi:hypothetical protein